MLKLYGHHKTARCSLEKISQASSFVVEKPYLVPNHLSSAEVELFSKDIVNYVRMTQIQIYFLRDSYPVAVLDKGKPFLLDKQFFGEESKRSS